MRGINQGRGDIAPLCSAPPTERFGEAKRRKESAEGIFFSSERRSEIRSWGGGEISAFGLLRLFAKKCKHFFASVATPNTRSFCHLRWQNRGSSDHPSGGKIKIESWMTLFLFWRRRGDSNSRSRFPQTNDLANHPRQPLGYPSVFSY